MGRQRPKGRAAAALLCAAACAAASPAIAHPHVFVGTFDQFVGDGDGHLTAIRTAWKFDELLSSSVLVDFDADRDGKLEPAELQKVAGTILGSSREHGYFTFLKQAGVPVAMICP